MKIKLYEKTREFKFNPCTNVLEATPFEYTGNTKEEELCDGCKLCESDLNGRSDNNTKSKPTNV